MANTLDPMDLKQIIILSKDGLSNRKIGTLLGISRNTVNTYVQRFKASDYEFDELLQLDESKLKELFTHKTTIDTDRQNELMQYFERINLARNHPGFTFEYHHRLYTESCSNPYSYTQFLDHYNRKFGQQKGSVKLEHEAGKELFVDFAGKKLEIINKETGEATSVEVFISILPNSHYTYVEACMSQNRDDFINCCRNALSFYGGVPKAIVSDNLKTAVTRASKYEPIINRTLKEFALHYGCVINPTRTYAPQDKALVENAVHLTYQRIYYPLREMTFFSLQQLNTEIRRLLNEYNKLLFKRKNASRLELFNTVERAYLKALPTQPYEIKDYRRAKVQKMGYVYFSPDRTYYSVPYKYIGHQTMIHYTSRNVEVYFNHERIALHKRNRSSGIYITNPDHLSSTHKAYINWSPEYFKKKAVKHGENVVLCVNSIIASFDYPEIAYKRVMGLLQLSKAYGSERLDKACGIAVIADITSYNRIKNILRNNIDQTFKAEEVLEDTISHIPEHNNIRGSLAYQ